MYKLKTITKVIFIVSMLLILIVFFAAKSAQSKETKVVLAKPCNFQEASQEFVNFIQKQIQENPKKFNRYQNDFQNLASEILILADEGKTEEICIKYAQFKKKF